MNTVDQLLRHCPAKAHRFGTAHHFTAKRCGFTVLEMYCTASEFFGALQAMGYKSTNGLGIYRDYAEMSYLWSARRLVAAEEMYGHE